MQQVAKRKGDLNPLKLKQQGFHQKGSLNLDSRLHSQRRIINQNEILDNKILHIKSKVDVKTIDEQYKVNECYIKNISKHSRRIVNCFLDEDKKRRY